MDRFPRPKKTKQVNVRLTAADLQRLTRTARARSLALGEYVREAALARMAADERRAAKAKKEAEHAA